MSNNSHNNSNNTNETGLVSNIHAAESPEAEGKNNGENQGKNSQSSDFNNKSRKSAIETYEERMNKRGQDPYSLMNVTSADFGRLLTDNARVPKNFVPTDINKFNTATRFVATYDNLTKLVLPGRTPFIGKSKTNKTNFKTDQQLTKRFGNMINDEFIFQYGSEVDFNDPRMISHAIPTLVKSEGKIKWMGLNSPLSIGSKQPFDGDEDLNILQTMNYEYLMLNKALSDARGTHFNIMDLTLMIPGFEFMYQGKVKRTLIPIIYFKYLNDVLFSELVKTRDRLFKFNKEIELMSGLNNAFAELLIELNGPTRQASSYQSKIASLGSSYILNTPIDIQYHDKWVRRFETYTKTSTGRDSALIDLTWDILPHFNNVYHVDADGNRNLWMNQALPRKICELLRQIRNVTWNVLSRETYTRNTSGVQIRTQIINLIDQVNRLFGQMNNVNAPYNDVVTYYVANKTSVYSTTLSRLVVSNKDKFSYLLRNNIKEDVTIIKSLTSMALRQYVMGLTNEVTYNGSYNNSMLNTLAQNKAQLYFTADEGNYNAIYEYPCNYTFFTPGRNGRYLLTRLRLDNTDFDLWTLRYNTLEHDGRWSNLNKFTTTVMRGKSFLNWFIQFVEVFFVDFKNAEEIMYDTNIQFNTEFIVNRINEQVLGELKWENVKVEEINANEKK